MIIIGFIQFIILTIWTIFIVYIISPFLNYKAAFWVTVHVWAPGIAFLLFTKIKVKGIENVKNHKNYIFMSNHASYFDIPCLLHASKRNLHFIAKEELSRHIMTGYMLKKLQIIFIDRTNAQRSSASMKKAAEAIKTGKNVGIFPEGTRTKTGKLGVFKKGGFKLAITSLTPIIPVAIEKSAVAWPLNNLGFKPTTVTVTFGKEISTEQYSEENIKELSDRVQKFISEITHN